MKFIALFNGQKTSRDTYTCLIVRILYKLLIIKAGYSYIYVIAELGTVFSTHNIKAEDITLGNIHILRQQKDWVVGSRKRPVLLAFSAVFMLINLVGLWVGQKNSKKLC